MATASQLTTIADLHSNSTICTEEMVQLRLANTNLKDQLAARDITISQQAKTKALVLVEVDKMATQFRDQREVLSKSVTAVAKKNKLTKFITGNQSLHYATTEPIEEVRREMALSKHRLRKEETSASIAQLAAIVDRFSGGPTVARYTPLSPDNKLALKKVVFHPDALPPAVPREFFGIWTFLEEPTKEELQIYKSFLLGPPPQLIFVPDSPPKSQLG